MRKPINKLEIVDISRLKRCHIYNGNTLRGQRMSGIIAFDEISLRRKRSLYEVFFLCVLFLNLNFQ